MRWALMTICLFLFFILAKLMDWLDMENIRAHEEECIMGAMVMLIATGVALVLDWRRKE